MPGLFNLPLRDTGMDHGLRLIFQKTALQGITSHIYLVAHVLVYAEDKFAQLGLPSQRVHLYL